MMQRRGEERRVMVKRWWNVITEEGVRGPGPDSGEQHTLCSLRSVVILGFLLHLKIRLPIGLHLSQCFCQTASGTFETYFPKYHDWPDATQCRLWRDVIELWLDPRTDQAWSEGKPGSIWGQTWFVGFEVQSLTKNLVWSETILSEFLRLEVNSKNRKMSWTKIILITRNLWLSHCNMDENEGKARKARKVEGEWGRRDWVNWDACTWHHGRVTPF